MSTTPDWVMPTKIICQILTIILMVVFAWLSIDVYINQNISFLKGFFLGVLFTTYGAIQYGLGMINVILKSTKY